MHNLGASLHTVAKCLPLLPEAQSANERFPPALTRSPGSGNCLCRFSATSQPGFSPSLTNHNTQGLLQRPNRLLHCLHSGVEVPSLSQLHLLLSSRGRLPFVFCSAQFPSQVSACS